MARYGTLITETRLGEALLLERDPLVGGAILAQAEPEELVARRVFELVVVAHLGHAAGGRRDLLGLDLVQLAELPLVFVVEVRDLAVELAEFLQRLDEVGVERRNIPDCDDLLVGGRRERSGATAQQKSELSTTARGTRASAPNRVGVARATHHSPPRLRTST